MKKLLILTLLFMGCDFAPTEHTHEHTHSYSDGEHTHEHVHEEYSDTTHTHDGVCYLRSEVGERSCNKSITIAECILDYGDWFEGITCEEICTEIIEYDNPEGYEQYTCEIIE